MKLTITIEQRYYKTPEGIIWTDSPHDYLFWKRYLRYFSTVIVAARVKAVFKIDKNYKRANGKNVEFLEIPYYVGPVGFAINYRQIIKQIRKIRKPDTAYCFRLPSILATMAIRLLKNDQFVLEVVGDPDTVFSSGANRSLFRSFFRILFSRNLRLECLKSVASMYVTDNYLQEKYPPSRKTFTVSCSDVILRSSDILDRPKKFDFIRNNKPIKIIYIGTLDELYKAPDILIKALALCKKKGLDFHLSLIGGGKYLNYLQKLARWQNVEKNVSFTGQVSGFERIKSLLDNSDVFVLPSKTEGLPRALLEAMARGVPSISTNVGGIPEILPTEALVEPNNISGLSKKILEFSSSKKLLERMSKRNMTVARRFVESRLKNKRKLFYSRVRELFNGLENNKKFQVGISVIMSAYNAEKYIAKAVESILEQSFRDFELIIFEDKSTDQTKNILRHYAKKDDRIRLIEKKKNNGQLGFARNLNRGIKIARGKYIARMDADDLSCPKRFEKQIRFLENHKKVFLVATSIGIIDKNDKLVSRLLLPSRQRLVKKLLEKNILCHSSIMFRNNKKYYYRPKMLLSEDYDLYLRIISNGDIIAGLKDKLVRFRTFSSKKITNKRKYQIMFANKAKEFYQQRMRQGSDQYKDFKPEEIFEKNPKFENSKTMIEFMIIDSFKILDLAKIKKLSEQYFSRYGINTNIYLIYLISKSRMAAILVRKILKFFKLSSW